MLFPPVSRDSLILHLSPQHAEPSVYGRSTRSHNLKKNRQYTSRLRILVQVAKPRQRVTAADRIQALYLRHEIMYLPSILRANSPY